MMMARRSFLEQGFYAPLSDAVNKLITELLSHQAQSSDDTGIIDAGSGEGYYISRLKQNLGNSLGGNSFYYFGVAFVLKSKNIVQLKLNVFIKEVISLGM